MEQVVKKDILDVLEKACKAIDQGNAPVLNELSNHTIHDASIYQDEDSVSIAILIYSLSKLVQHCCEAGKSYKPMSGMLKDARTSLKEGNLGKYNRQIKKIFTEVKKLDKKLNFYVQEIIDKAKLKKGSKFSDHGLSIARTAEFLGLSQWELLSYVGKTSMPDVHPLDTITAVKRVKMARKMFS